MNKAPVLDYTQVAFSVQGIF